MKIFRTTSKRRSIGFVLALALVSHSGTTHSETSQTEEPTSTAALVLEGIQALAGVTSIVLSQSDSGADSATTIHNRNMLKALHERWDTYDSVFMRISEKLDGHPQRNHLNMMPVYKRTERNEIRELGSRIEDDLTRRVEGKGPTVKPDLRIHDLEVARVKLIDDLLATKDPSPDDIRALLIAMIYELRILISSSDEEGQRRSAEAYVNGFKRLLDRAYLAAEYHEVVWDHWRKDSVRLRPTVDSWKSEISRYSASYVPPEGFYRGWRRFNRHTPSANLVPNTDLGLICDYGGVADDMVLTRPGYTWVQDTRAQGIVLKYATWFNVGAFGISFPAIGDGTPCLQESRSECNASFVRHLDEFLLPADLAIGAQVNALLNHANWSTVVVALINHMQALSERFSIPFNVSMYPAPKQATAEDGEFLVTFEQDAARWREDLISYGKRVPWVETSCSEVSIKYTLINGLTPTEEAIGFRVPGSCRAEERAGSKPSLGTCPHAPP